jgi:hypothetical protein
MPILAPVVAGFRQMRHPAGRHSEASHSSAKPAGTWVALESIESHSCGCGPSNKHMRAIGGNSGNRCDATEEQYAVSARIGDVWKPLKRLANLGQWSGEARAQVAAILILNPGGYCHETHRPEFRNHAARLQGPRESGGAGREQLPRLDADLSVQRLPPFRASRIARWISAVPPNQKMVRVGWPAGRLGAIKRLQCRRISGMRKTALCIRCVDSIARGRGSHSAAARRGRLGTTQ